MTALKPVININLNPHKPRLQPSSWKKLVAPTLLFLIVALAISLPVFLFRQKLAATIRRQTIHSLRALHLLRPTAPGYFEALNTQNPLYDYNNDGLVTGEDYSQVIAAATASQPVSATAVSGSDPTAASENLNYPSIRGYSSDIFNGVATANVPISLPPGPAGLQPSLGLSYSSSVIDDMWNGLPTNLRNDPSHGYQKQASIVGLGWNLSSMGTISRDVRGTLNETSDDTFLLSFAGGAANLIKESGDDSYAVFRTAPNIKVKVERWGLSKAHLDPDGNPLTIWRYYWSVATGDGTKYFFGNPAVDNWHRSYDLEKSYFTQGSGNSWYPLYGSDNNGPQNAFSSWLYYTPYTNVYHNLQQSWLVTKVENLHQYRGSKANIVFNYTPEIGTYDNNKYYTKTIYQQSITYGPHQVLFQYEPRLDYQTHQDTNANPNQTFTASQRLAQIRIQTQDRNGTYRTRNAYSLRYLYGFNTAQINANQDGTPMAPITSGLPLHSLLTSVTQWNGEPYQSEQLPAQTFSYGANCDTFINGCPLTSYKANAPDHTQTRSANDFFLKTATNGYGGWVDYEYYGANANGSDNALTVTYCDQDKKDVDGTPGCKSDHAYNTQRHRLSAQIAHDGLGNSFRTAYVYTANPLAYVKTYYYLDQVFSCGKCTASSETNKCGSGDWCTPPENVGYCTCKPGYANCSETCCNSCEKAVSDVTFEPFADYEFLGYPDVKVITYQKNGTSQIAAQSSTQFVQKLETDTCFKPHPLKGIAYRQWQYDVTNQSNPTPSSTTETYYETRIGPMFSTYPERYTTGDQLNAYCPNYNPDTTIFVNLPIDTINKTYLAGQPSLCTRATTTYDYLTGVINPYILPGQQINWGQVACNDPNQDVPSDTPQITYTRYSGADTNLWLLPKPVETWTTDHLSAVKYNHTRIYYDNQNFGVLGTYGNVTATETISDTSISRNSIAYQHPQNTSLATSTTDALGRTSTTEYDTVYHQYPVKTTNVLNQSVSIEYDFNTTDSSHPNYQNGTGVLGLPLKTTDVNGATTISVYDSWGRSKNTYLPGRTPSTNQPNSFTNYYYYNETEMNPCDAAHYCLKSLGSAVSGAPSPKMMVASGQLIDDTPPTGRWSVGHTYINGLGQTVQARSLWFEGSPTNGGIPIETEGLRDLITSTSYNSLGQVDYQSLPYSASPHLDQNLNSFDSRSFITDPSIRKTFTLYDGLGRAIRTDYPDGTNTQTVFDLDNNPLKTKVLGPNCTDNEANTLCTETISENTVLNQKSTATVIAGSQTLTTQTINHTVLGLPLKIVDPQGTTTSEILYDTLGRKTKMWDLDLSP